MSTSSPVVLILGSGPNVGSSVARGFAAKGYKVALVSRSLKEGDSTADQVSIPADLSDPDSVIAAFSKVKASLGLPSVVIYNGRPLLPPPQKIFAETLLTFPKLVHQLGTTKSIRSIVP